MKINPIKTDKITPGKYKLTDILDKYLPIISENSILAVTSKIVSICEGSVARNKNKHDLIKQEADLILSNQKNIYGIDLTIKNNILIPNAGIDESNGAGYFILWPKDPNKSAAAIRSYLINRFKLKNIGVIITDSKTTPLKWGTTGTCLAHAGFSALNNYIGKKDIFGRKLQFTKANIADGLAAACVLAMGEGSEQTPLCLIEDIHFVNFSLKKEDLKISLSEDLYAPLLTSVRWKNRQNNSRG